MVRRPQGSNCNYSAHCQIVSYIFRGRPASLKSSFVQTIGALSSFLGSIYGFAMFAINAYF